MSNAFINERYKNVFMKISPIKFNTPAPKKITVKKASPIKDALIVSGYCSLPVVFYEAASLIAKRLNKKMGKTDE